MQKRTGWIAALFVACVALPSNAADLFNNLSDASTDGDLILSTNSMWAQSFRTGAAGIADVVNSVSAKFYRSSGSTGLIEFYIWDVNPGDIKPVSPPSRNVGFVDVSTFSTDANTPTQVDFTGLSISLSANTHYYLIARGAGSFSGTALWSRTSSQPASPGYTWNLTSSSDAGVNWATPTSNPTNSPLMRITAVPEPSTYALGMIAAATVGFVSRRRARKSA